MMDKPKIALLCNGYGLVKRGAERFTEEFFYHCKDIFDITIFGINETDHSIGIGSKPRDKFNIPWRNGRAYLESYYFGKKWYNQILKKENFDVILNNSGFPCSYWSNKFREKTGIPFITRARGGGYEEKLSRYFKPNIMIFLSHFHKNLIDNGNIKTAVIPNAIDTRLYQKHNTKSKLVTKFEKPLFLSTSALVGYKRNDLCIKAVAKLEKGTLIQTSDGNLRDKTNKLGNTLLGGRYKYLGLISRNELIDLYHSCNVYINASKKEAFGVVYLEAMASGLPIVTQLDERRKEIIGDGGILINCRNINKFSEALSTAAKKNWVEVPMNQANKYDWKIIKNKYDALIKSLI